ncbi:MAG: PHP domain-containing protein [Clostridia bacterium]|nr:PHP domain-containing protein [Clostridia bacterium]
MSITVDYHTHTRYSHGKSTILENAIEAKNKGLKEIAITDHGFGHRMFSVKPKELNKMKLECQEASLQTGVNVKLGVECNILGISGKLGLNVYDVNYFEVCLAGIHKFITYDKFYEWDRLLIKNLLVSKLNFKPSKALIKRNTEIYINAIKNNPIDVLAHPCYDLVADAVEIAKCCRDYGTLFEIDARKTQLSDEEWTSVFDTGVNFIISSDAHVSSNVGNVESALSIVKRLNLNEEQIVNINGKIPNLTRFKDYKNKL